VHSKAMNYIARLFGVLICFLWQNYKKQLCRNSNRISELYIVMLRDLEEE